MENFSESPEPEESGTRPVVCSIPTLGRTVRLGELYDQRLGQFLGVQLYTEPRDKDEVVETQIKHTDLSLGLSTTFEDKASLLDIDPKLSLEILSGLVKVSGSASYLKDIKSNTHEQSFALALRIRLREKRILFAESKLGRDILDVASEDYIEEGLATHFVSSIVYGGNLIVNLIAKQSNVAKNERLEGQLKARLDKLKGAISLEAGVEADAKDRFNPMDDKFDLVVHGDVSLKRLPINPKDLLDTIPKAALLISDHGGVPISVTLHPIPEALTREKVHEFDVLFAGQVLKVFSQLDDLRNRFSSLVDSINDFEEFVPELVRVARAAADQYAEEHGILLHQLQNYLHDYQYGKIQLQSNGIFKGSKKEDGSYDIPVLALTRNLHMRHLQPGDDEKDVDKGSLSRYYPSTLVGLENELRKFRYFVSDIQKLKDSVKSIDANYKGSVCLSNIDDVCGAVRLQNKISLFVMTPLTPKTAKLKSDLVIVQFLAILRENATHFNDPSAPALILYVEDLKDLEFRLPNNGKFSGLEHPSLFFGNVDAKGELSWSDTSTSTPVSSTVVSSTSSTREFSLKLRHKASEKFGEISYIFDAVNTTQSFSFSIQAKRAASDRQSAGWTICVLRYTESRQKYLSFEMPLRVLVHHDPDAFVPVSVDSREAPPVDKLFLATFVQDTEVRKWSLYLDDKLVGTEVPPPSRKLTQQSTSVELYYPGDIHWWKGEVCEVKAFSYALTQEQVAAEVKKMGDMTN